MGAAQTTTVAKPFYRSSTLWLNALAFVAIALQIASNSTFLDPDLQALALALLNLFNRFRTNSPVRL